MLGAGGVLLEYPAHDRSLRFVDHELAAATVCRGHAAVSVAHAADVIAAIELTRQAAVRLLAQVVEVQLIDQAARDAHHLAAARLRVVAIGRPDDADSAELEPLDDLVLLADVAA
jgi:hypothetical protein